MRRGKASACFLVESLCCCTKVAAESRRADQIRPSCHINNLHSLSFQSSCTNIDIRIISYSSQDAGS